MAVGQVNIALQVLEELNSILGSAEWLRMIITVPELIVPYKELPIDKSSEMFKLITRIQDETHRFAIEYHRSLRKKRQVHSILDDIKNRTHKKKSTDEAF